MDPFIIFLIIVISVLTTVLTIVGIQIIFILKQVRQSLQHINHTLETTDDLVHILKNPFLGMGDMVQGVKSGLKMAEVFIVWLRQQQQKHLEEVEVKDASKK